MRYAGFLRAVNVAGNLLSMAALKNLLSDIGLDDPETILQSGNIVFGASRRNTAELEALLERETEKWLKVRTEYFIRDPKELERIIGENPFPREAEEDPGHLVVAFVKSPAAASAVKELQSRISGPEVVRAGGRQIYVTYPAGIGRSKLTNAIIEKALGTRCTGRNWNTIMKIAAAMKR